MKQVTISTDRWYFRQNQGTADMWRVKQVGEAKALATGLATGLATRPATRLALALVGFTGPLACVVLLGAAVPAFADTYPWPPDNEAVVGDTKSNCTVRSCRLLSAAIDVKRCVLLSR